MKLVKLTKPSLTDVVISTDWEDFASACDKALGGAKKIMIVTDSKVYKLYGRFLDKYFPNAKIYYHKIPSGESGKDFQVYYELTEVLYSLNFCRNDAIIAFGGGSVGDLAGFVAATFMRGMKFVSVPTTILAMVDSSIGGKNAVDFNGAKNLVGTFYSPQLVFVDVNLAHLLLWEETCPDLGHRYGPFYGPFAALRRNVP